MTLRSSTLRAVLLASALGTLAIGPAAAQQPAAPAPAAAPLPPGSPLIGRPDTEAAMKIAPIPVPPTPAAADKLPIGKLKLPKGFNIEVYVSGIHNPRSMRQGDKGTIFVGSRFSGKVLAIVEKDGKREVKTIAEGLRSPNGIAFHKGNLYVAEINKIWRYDNIESNLDKPNGKVIYDQLPNDNAHGWKFIAVGPDEKLYIPVGGPCNICLPPDTHAQMRRINLDGSGMEVVARGIRNTVGFDWHPVSKELYFTDNGRDWMSESLPEEELNRITKVGQHFGFPFCHQGNVLDQEFGWGKSCDDYVKPVALLGAHAAALGMRFYPGGAFPAKYKNTIFVARRGSWNRAKPHQADIVVVSLKRDGSVDKIEPFLTGWTENNVHLGRNSDLVFLKDGSMLVNDDHNGAIYRITYGKQRTAGR